MGHHHPYPLQPPHRLLTHMHAHVQKHRWVFRCHMHTTMKHTNSPSQSCTQTHKVCGVCVCVTHLNRCKTSAFVVSFFHNYCRGVQSTVETAPNEAIHLCWKQSLINSVYLQNSGLNCWPSCFWILHRCRNLVFDIHGGLRERFGAILLFY